ncbi:MAG TPA: hypothetical protein DD670_07690 [Planctomycetaceae bacterium]|nr:hypothetical protein [Planctomycetaceae bacterium]
MRPFTISEPRVLAPPRRVARVESYHEGHEEARSGKLPSVFIRVYPWFPSNSKSPNPQIPKSLSSAFLRALRGEICFSASRRLGGEEPTHRRAITLIELLVVITIMMLLAAYALPKMQPASEQRRIREAARMVSVFMARAANRAKETGRPCGVKFQFLENPVISPTGGESRAASNTLFEVEVPPAYAGLSTDSRVTVQVVGNMLRVNSMSGDLDPLLIQQGDLMQLNNQGPWYRIAALGTDTAMLEVNPERLTRTPWTSTLSAPVPFTILRQPSPTIAPPLRLPRGTVVDLGWSGTNQDRRQFSSGDGDVMVLFSPNGSVSRYYYYPPGGTRETVTPSEPLFFLVGREMQVGLKLPDYLLWQAKGVSPENVPDEEKPNWQLPDNLWITVSPQTGLIAVTESAEPTDFYAAGPPWVEDDGIDEARAFAKQSRGMGGR